MEWSTNEPRCTFKHVFQQGDTITRIAFMRSRQATHNIALGCAVLLLLISKSARAGSLTTAMPHVQGTRRIVLEQLEALLAKNPRLQIIGQGSWLKTPAELARKGGSISRAYADPLLGGTSDQDLRFISNLKEGKNGMTPAQVEELAGQWRNVQKELKEGIEGIFKNADPKTIEKTLLQYGFNAEQAAAISKNGAGEVVAKILKSVNLYSPPQLIRGIVDEKTAAATFKRLGSIPNLGGRVIEGVWGEGAEAAVQEFESGGRLFYRASDGVLRAGFVDLVHMAEGYGRYSLGGAANMSLQWAEKAAEALNEGDPKLLAKYLKRLRSTFSLAVKKGNLGSGAMAESFSQLETFIVQAEAEGATLEKAGLQKFLRSARMEASLLSELARNPGAQDRQIIMAILDATSSGSRWGKVGEWFRSVWETADNMVIFERTLQGVFLVFSVWQVSGTWGEKGMEQALRQAGVEGAMLASLPVGAVLLLANHMLDQAKDTGYNLSVKSQEWNEFLAGISSVKGYEGETGLNRSIEELALKQASTEEVKRTVELQADNISKLKDFGVPDGDATASSRQAIKEKLITNMTPIVLAEWLSARKRIMTEYLDMLLELDYRMNNLVVRARSNPALVSLEQNGPASADLRLETDQNIREIEDLLGRMEAKIKPLGGKDKLVAFGYRATVEWDQDGQKKEVTSLGNLRNILEPQTFQFSGRGSHEVTANLKIEVYVMTGGGLDEAPDVSEAKPLLERTYERKIPLTVDVVTVARAKAEPLKEAKLETPKETTVGDIIKLSWDRKEVPNFKTGKYRVVLTKSGAKLDMADFMMLSFDPSGGVMGDKLRFPVTVLSEKEEGDRINIEVQIPQVHDIKETEQMELAFVFLDKEASLDSQLKNAMEALDKANEEMENKMAAMTPEEQEAFQKKFEEEMEKVAANPPPLPSSEEANAMPLPPGTVISYPILVQPPSIQLKAPGGWEDQQDDRRFWRRVGKKAGSPTAGNHVFVDATYDIHLDAAGFDELTGGFIEENFANARKGAQTVRAVTSSGFKGELLQFKPYRNDSSSARHLSASGEALLKKGKVYMGVSYQTHVSGFREVTMDDQGREVVLYDTRPEADTEHERILKDINGLLGSMKMATTAKSGEPTAATEQAPGEDAFVRLVPAKTECESGEFVEIVAVVEKARSGSGPFRYEWSGNHAGSGDKVVFFASEPGSYPVHVMVYGSKGLIGQASVDLKVQ
jgi:hypothetical protein